MQTDVTSSTKPAIAKEFTAVLRATSDYTTQKIYADALAVLSNWDGRHDLNDVAPTIFIR